MNLEEVKRFINQVRWGAFATTDGRKVGVRPMSGMAWKENQLWCATGASSDKAAQLKKVPYAEYCFCDSTGKHVRIAGPCTISSNSADKLWLYKAVPALKEHIADPGSPEYVVVKMMPDNIRVMEITDWKYKQIELK
jgi:general stress protein 26